MYTKGHFKESSDLFPENQPVRGNGSELFDKIPVCNKNKEYPSIWTSDIQM